jgi:hypothetical protein
MRRSTVFWITGVSCLLALMALSVAVVQRCRTSSEWQQRSDEFARRINSVGARLAPGGTEAMELHASDADELILLGFACSREQLRARFPRRNSALTEQLVETSWERRRCPALIWLRNGRIISRNRIAFNVAANISVQSWSLQGRREINVTKERNSPNGFLSVSLLEDSEQATPER